MCEEWEMWDDSPDYDEMEDFGCWFGTRCMMPGLHFPSECHTAEMMEAEIKEDSNEGTK